ncbi:hypothetical protein [Paraburkholderia hayleyella]|uniref:hypothetical protein n=1 Tax=Paraburkholderia hayleyella TaxID=2152889 RepID=UPI001291DE26|nr:hypothetical protein [Paraburkholderia hayleyella]
MSVDDGVNHAGLLLTPGKMSLALSPDKENVNVLTASATENGVLLSGLAAGTNAKDAVNKGQFDTLSDATTAAQATADKAQDGLKLLDGISVTYDGMSKDKVTLGGGADGTTLSNVKNGIAPKDAVNRSQLDTVNTTLSKAAQAAQAAADTAQSGVVTLDGVAAKYDSTAKNKLTLGGTDGGTTLSNVKAGTVALDAVNKSQLDTVNTTLSKAAQAAQATADTAQSGVVALDRIAAKYDSTAKNKLTLGGRMAARR